MFVGLTPPYDCPAVGSFCSMKRKSPCHWVSCAQFVAVYIFTTTVLRISSACARMYGSRNSETGLVKKRFPFPNGWRPAVNWRRMECACSFSSLSQGCCDCWMYFCFHNMLMRVLCHLLFLICMWPGCLEFANLTMGRWAMLIHLFWKSPWMIGYCHSWCLTLPYTFSFVFFFVFFSCISWLAIFILQEFGC